MQEYCEGQLERVIEAAKGLGAANERRRIFNDIWKSSCGIGGALLFYGALHGWDAMRGGDTAAFGMGMVSVAIGTFLLIRARLYYTDTHVTTQRKIDGATHDLAAATERLYGTIDEWIGHDTQNRQR